MIQKKVKVIDLISNNNDKIESWGSTRMYKY